MGKIVVCVLIGSFFFSACLKKDNGCSYSNPTAVAPAAEQQELKAYLDSMGIKATLSTKGFYYSVSQGGSGMNPGQCSQITVGYKGWLTNGNSFDQQASIVFTSLGSLIDGWRDGIPLIRQGGDIKLYIPPSLGYGSKGITDNSGNIVVPPNSIIIFDISLLDVQ
jgi:FKBP-type peptidyl-prolyl cis-trans isomerase FkpA